MDPIRLAIADSAPIFLKALDATLNKEKKFKVVVKADSGAALMRQLLHRQVDIVMLETTLPVQNGLECLLEIREKYPLLKAMVLTTQEDAETIRACMSLGACSYLLKTNDEKRIIKAIIEVHRHGAYIDELLAKTPSKDFSPTRIANEVSLQTGISFSPRDITIIQMMCREMTSKDIAASLHYSERTVEAYRNNIIKKIGCRNIAGVITFAIKNRLVYC